MRENEKINGYFRMKYTEEMKKKQSLKRTEKSQYLILIEWIN